MTYGKHGGFFAVFVFFGRENTFFVVIVGNLESQFIFYCTCYLILCQPFVVGVF